MEEVVEKYAVYLRDVKGASENTILSYQRDLRHFIRFLKDSGVKKIQDVNRTNITAYLLNLQKEGDRLRQFQEILLQFVLFFNFYKRQMSYKKI